MNVDIKKVEKVDSVFICNLFDKRDNFPFFIVQMPYIPTNLSSTIFCGKTFQELISAYLEYLICLHER